MKIKIISFFLNVWQILLFPFRLIGVFGTYNNPRYFETDDKVPNWVFARNKRNINITFMRKVEVYYDLSIDCMTVRPVNICDENKDLIIIKDCTDAVICGAPTIILLKCRNGGTGIKNNKLIEQL